MKALEPRAGAAAVREYLSTEQLAAVSPWSVAAIGKLVARGALRPGVHYFQPFGRRTKLIFKWSAIVALIEGRPADAAVNAVNKENGKVVDVERTTEELQRLLG